MRLPRCPWTSECSACPQLPTNLSFSQGLMERGDSTTLCGLRGQEVHREKAATGISLNPCSWDRIYTPAWFADVRFKRIEKEDCIHSECWAVLRDRTPSSTIPGGDGHRPGHAHLCSSPQLTWKRWREAESSSYHGIPDSSPPSLTLMILESDVYMLSLKV